MKPSVFLIRLAIIMCLSILVISEEPPAGVLGGTLAVLVLCTSFVAVEHIRKHATQLHIQMSEQNINGLYTVVVNENMEVTYTRLTGGNIIIHEMSQNGIALEQLESKEHTQIQTEIELWHSKLLREGWFREHCSN